MNSKYRLYVWEDVLADYTSGIMFAIASSVEEARILILKEYDEDAANIAKRNPYDERLSTNSMWNDLFNQKPIVLNKKQGFYCWGGG